MALAILANGLFHDLNHGSISGQISLTCQTFQNAEIFTTPRTPAVGFSFILGFDSTLSMIWQPRLGVIDLHAFDK
jgi:hypothetical protein